MENYLIIISIILFISTITLLAINYSINKKYKRCNKEAQYWCEEFIKANKQLHTDEYDNVI
jgi:hypothetical protein